MDRTLLFQADANPEGIAASLLLTKGDGLLGGSQILPPFQPLRRELDPARRRRRGHDRRAEPVWRIHQVVMPISIAGILTAVIFAFTLVTQEFVYGVTFIPASSSYTVSVGVPTFLVRGDVYFRGSMMAACLIASVPIATIYNFFL
jgi:hypothetical protein